MYTDDGRTKDDILGRVSVQVKGRSHQSKKIVNETSTNYAVDRASLNFFEKHRGGIYLYVVSPHVAPVPAGGDEARRAVLTLVCDCDHCRVKERATDVGECAAEWDGREPERRTTHSSTDSRSQWSIGGTR